MRALASLSNEPHTDAVWGQASNNSSDRNCHPHTRRHIRGQHGCMETDKHTPWCLLKSKHTHRERDDAYAWQWATMLFECQWSPASANPMTASSQSYDLGSFALKAVAACRQKKTKNLKWITNEVKTQTVVYGSLDPFWRDWRKHMRQHSLFVR